MPEDSVIETNRIVIVGDSFCCQDSDYDDAWSTRLTKAWPGQVINLAYAGASNFGILMQIERAIELDPDLIIHHATSSVRVEIVLRECDVGQRPWLDRMINRDPNDLDLDILTTTWFTANVLGQMSPQDEQQFVAYHQRFTDLDTEIRKNYYWILMALERMRNRRGAYSWSQGGFEHARFGAVMSWDFAAYEPNRSPVNPWDLVDSDRCSHHIENSVHHLTIFDHYDELVRKTLDTA